MRSIVSLRIGGNRDGGNMYSKSYEEINQLSEEEKLKYFNEKNEQIHLNSITYEIYDEMNFEDKKTYYLESLSSDDEVIYDDY